jgi:outer membrane protein OmpA-like peptidoglycan-associated protein
MTVPNCQIPIVHFRLGSAVIAPQEEGIVFSGLGQCNITLDTPLVITGYTCELGSDQYNKTLSMQRARAVAHLLQVHGFTVTKVRSKAAQDPITRLPEEFYKNRRVEIEVTP